MSSEAWSTWRTRAPTHFRATQQLDDDVIGTSTATPSINADESLAFPRLRLRASGRSPLASAHSPISTIASISSMLNTSAW